MCLDSGPYGGPANSNRRRSLNKQLKKLGGALSALPCAKVSAVSGAELDGAAPPPPKCRSCGRACKSLLDLMELPVPLGTDVCDGRCWGFFQAVRRKEGYVDIFSGS